VSAWDLITVGGGLGGAALARAMAERGARVLVVEREREFRDRVRGEVLSPWGVAEARALGIADRLLATCGQELRFLDTYLGPMQVMHRDLVETTPQHAGFLAFFHPAMQETLLEAAREAGAEVRRGARVREVVPGDPARVTVEADGQGSQERARLVVGADGRASLVRRWGGFAVRQDPEHLLISGLLLEDTALPSDTARFVLEPTRGSGVLLFPQPGRMRLYLVHQASAGRRLQGASDVPGLLDEAFDIGAPREAFADARPVGPLATFDCADTWVPHPYESGVALIGDAGTASDPAWGQGLAITLRDVRLLRDRLLAGTDWDAAGHAYAEEHDRFWAVTHTSDGWASEMFYRTGPEADERRARALPLLAADPTRAPDHAFSGPDLPADEATRRRFFAED
jgi:2-polyprenyl-6-methoxyphenol hydroxylase-like FAD-dependent oxidoreductase